MKGEEIAFMYDKKLSTENRFVDNLVTETVHNVQI